jgi:hypothetical protein
MFTSKGIGWVDLEARKEKDGDTDCVLTAKHEGKNQ